LIWLQKTQKLMVNDEKRIKDTIVIKIRNKGFRRLPINFYLISKILH
jgi:hypothetical protein